MCCVFPFCIIDQTFHLRATLLPNLTLLPTLTFFFTNVPNSGRFPYDIRNGCGMPIEGGRLLLWTSVLSHLVLAYVLMLLPASSSCFRTLNSEYPSILLYFFNAFDTVVVVLCFLFLFFLSQFFNVIAIKFWTFYMQFLCNFIR